MKNITYFYCTLFCLNLLLSSLLCSAAYNDDGVHISSPVFSSQILDHVSCTQLVATVKIMLERGQEVPAVLQRCYDAVVKNDTIELCQDDIQEIMQLLPAIIDSLKNTE